MFGLAQSQKIGDITFYRNLLGLVWFFDNGLWREVVLSQLFCSQGYLLFLNLNKHNGKT